MKVKTKIIKVKGDWKEVLNDCRFTANKGDIDKDPSDEFKQGILIAEHSPIRDIIFKWEWLNIPHWTVVHWVRHKWEKFVPTQRSDRTGVDRHSLAQDNESAMRGEANVQHLIDTMRKRLCFMASPETREEAESLKMAITVEDPFVGDVMVPNCIYRCGCPEGKKGCKFFKQYQTFFEGMASEEMDITNIRDRYAVYNVMFYSKQEE